MTKDAWRHILLGLAFWCIAIICILLFPAVVAAGAIACLCIYYREVTQLQTKSYDSDIREGWNYRLWSRAKNIETWFPIGAIMVFTLVVYIVIL